MCARLLVEAEGRFDVHALAERFVISASIFFSNIFQAVGFPFPIVACHTKHMLHVLVIKITDNHQRKDVKWRVDHSGYSCEIPKCVACLLVLEGAGLNAQFHGVF